eukprot:scaffold9175_cov57-Phaeocystis_antarctica.AAC.3
MALMETPKRAPSSRVVKGVCGRHRKSIITPTVQCGESSLAEASIAFRKGSSRRSCAPSRSGWNQSSHGYESTRTPSESLFWRLPHSLRRQRLCAVISAAGGTCCRPQGMTPPPSARATIYSRSTSGV